MLISEPIPKKSVQRTIEYINRSLEFFYHTEYLLDMFENDLFYIDYRERKKVVLQLPMLSVERDDEGDLKTTFGIEGQGSESVL